MDSKPREDTHSHRQTGGQSEDRPVEEAEAVAGTPPEQAEPLFARERFRNIREEVVDGYPDKVCPDSPVSRSRRVQDGRDSPTGPTAGTSATSEPLNGRERSGDSRGEAVDGYPDKVCPDSPVSRSRRVQDGRDDPDRSGGGPDPTPEPLNGQERSGEGGVEAVGGYPDKVCPDSPVGEGHRNTKHRGQNSVRIAGERYSVETLVDVERIKRQNRAECGVIMSSLDDSTKVGILSALLTASPRTYDELGTWTNKSKKTIKRRLSDLRDAGVVEVEDGRPSTVAFRDDDIRLIASDVLSYL